MENSFLDDREEDRYLPYISNRDLEAVESLLAGASVEAIAAVFYLMMMDVDWQLPNGKGHASELSAEELEEAVGLDVRAYALGCRAYDLESLSPEQRQVHEMAARLLWRRRFEHWRLLVPTAEGKATHADALEALLQLAGNRPKDYPRLYDYLMETRRMEPWGLYRNRERMAAFASGLLQARPDPQAPPLQLYADPTADRFPTAVRRLMYARAGYSGPESVRQCLRAGSLEELSRLEASLDGQPTVLLLSRWLMEKDLQRGESSVVRRWMSHHRIHSVGLVSELATGERFAGGLALILCLREGRIGQEPIRVVFVDHRRVDTPLDSLGYRYAWGEETAMEIGPEQAMASLQPEGKGAAPAAMAAQERIVGHVTRDWPKARVDASGLRPLVDQLVEEASRRKTDKSMQVLRLLGGELQMAIENPDRFLQSRSPEAQRQEVRTRYAATLADMRTLGMDDDAFDILSPILGEFSCEHQEFRVEDKFNPLRQLLEKLFRGCHSRGILPAECFSADQRTNLAWCCRFLTGGTLGESGPRYRFGHLLDERQGNILRGILGYCNEGSHNASPLNSRKELLLGSALQLCDIIHELVLFSLDHPRLDPESLLWRLPQQMCGLRCVPVPDEKGLFHHAQCLFPGMAYLEQGHQAEITSVEWNRDPRTKEQYPYLATYETVACAS